MGGGPTNRPEQAKSIVNLLAEVPATDEFAGMAARSIDFCQRPGDVRFLPLEGVDVAVGMTVRVISAADPMPVMNGTGLIGVVDPTVAVALRACLAIGFLFEGQVSSVDPDESIGTIALSGLEGGEV